MASAQEHGEVFLQFESSNGGASKTPLDTNSRVVGHVVPASATDRRQFFPLAYGHGGAVLDESGFLKLKFKPDAADVIESEECQLIVDVTFISKSTGQAQPSTITLEQMTSFKPSGTIDLTLIAGQTTEVAYYQVPAGNQMVLGHPSGLGKAYIYIGDDT